MMKHLLRKNGTRRTLEVEDNVQCEKLLNNLAKQHKQQQSTIENSSPPSKRQTLLWMRTFRLSLQTHCQGWGPFCSGHRSLMQS